MQLSLRIHVVLNMPFPPNKEYTVFGRSHTLEVGEVATPEDAAAAVGGTVSAPAPYLAPRLSL